MSYDIDVKWKVQIPNVAVLKSALMKLAGTDALEEAFNRLCLNSDWRERLDSGQCSSFWDGYWYPWGLTVDPVEIVRVILLNASEGSSIILGGDWNEGKPEMFLLRDGKLITQHSVWVDTSTESDDSEPAQG